jgi:hypothetical protein
MPTEKEVERDIDGAEVEKMMVFCRFQGWCQAEQKVWHPAWHHTCTRASIDDIADKVIKNDMKIGKNDAIDEHVKNGMFFISFKT